MARKMNPIDREELWRLLLSRLREFKKTYGHCNVPQKYPQDQKLAYWVHNQRSFWRRNRLRQDRIDILTILGFVWDVRAAEWEEMFAELQKFKETHGSFLRPRRWEGDRELERWVHEQRKLYRNQTLDPERLRRLQRICFNWEAQEAIWEEMFAALVAYKQAHEHCNVPHRWPENRAFGNWVALQRTLARKGHLPKERLARLDDLGFHW